MANTWNVRIAFVCALLGASAWAQDDEGGAGVLQYQAMLADDNPADLWIAKGEEIWKTKRGPKNASLEKCNLGLGPGVVKGALAQMPRYFADSGKVEDIESRLVTCMVKLQGFTVEEAIKNRFAKDEQKSEIEPLVAWIASMSKGMKVAVPQKHPKEKEAYEIGKQIFFYRSGTHDWGCVACHGQDGKRIRLQALPQLSIPAGAKQAFPYWPAYRWSHGEVRTFQHRLYDCFRQQRFPEPKYISDATIAVITFLGVSASGAEMAAPSVKR